MNNNIRSAAIGGIAATFIVAAAFAPKLMSHSSQVNVHNTSTEAAASPDEATTTSFEAAGDIPGDIPEDTPETTVPTTDELVPPTAPPVTTTTVPKTLDDRVTGVEDRVTGIEQRLVTPTTAPAAPVIESTTTTTVHIPEWTQIARLDFGPGYDHQGRNLFDVTLQTGQLRATYVWPTANVAFPNDFGGIETAIWVGRDSGPTGGCGGAMASLMASSVTPSNPDCWYTGERPTGKTTITMSSYRFDPGWLNGRWGGVWSETAGYLLVEEYR